jgi:hypothetical protein
MERPSDGALIWFMIWGFTTTLLIVILHTVDEVSITTQYANSHIFHAWCREHQGEIVNYNTQDHCVRNGNLHDQLVMPDYFKIHGRRRD